MPRNALQALIACHLEDTGESIADVAARGGMSRQTVSAILHREGPQSMPHRATIDKLARGLKVSVQTVEAAAASAARMDAARDPVDPRVATLVDLAEHLPPHRLQALTVLARVLADTK